MKFFKFRLDETVILILMAKLMMSSLSGWDCLAGLSIFLYLQADHISSHIFPKRPDLFKDVALLHDEMAVLIHKIDVLESDVSAMRVGSVRGGR